MPHYYPIVIQSGRSLAGESLGFHAYSLRVDNLTNQWMLEETSMAWIPPYSLGMCLRLYGTGVAIILNQVPVGQVQPSALAGEQCVGVYSDQLRTEVAGTPVRQYSLVQAVTDLNQGAMPAFPPSGTDRLWADNQGNIHHLHSDGTDYQLVDPHNATALLYPIFDPHYQAMMSATAVGGDSSGTVGNIQNNSARSNFTVAGILSAGPAGGAQAGDISANRGNGTGVIYFGGNHYLFFDGTNFQLIGASGITLSGSVTVTGNLNAGGWVSCQNGYYYNNAARPFVTFGGETLFWDAGNGGYRWVNSGNSVQWASLNSGGLTVNVGNTTLTGNVTAANGHFMSSVGNFYPVTNTSGQNGYVGWDANSGSGSSIATGAIYCSPAMTAAGRVMAMQAWVGSLGGNNNCFLGPNIGDYRGQGLAQAWGTWSSVDHARQYGLPVEPVTDPMQLVRSITGYYYAHASMIGPEPILRDNGDVESNMTYGFAAAEVNANIPEMATEEWVDTSRLIAILWEAVKELDTRIERLETPA